MAKRVKTLTPLTSLTPVNEKNAKIENTNTPPVKKSTISRHMREVGLSNSSRVPGIYRFSEVGRNLFYGDAQRNINYINLINLINWS